MKEFTLVLRGTSQHKVIEGVTSFVGEDATGSFGILPGHGRMMTVLIFGLARFCVKNSSWQYLAMPGAVLYFVNNKLTLNSRSFLLSDDYDYLSKTLLQSLLTEEEKLSSIKNSLRHMEENILRRLRDISRLAE